MSRFTGLNRTVLQFVAVAIVVAGQPMVASAENDLQLHVPQTFSSAASAAHMDDDASGLQPTLAAGNMVEIVQERYPDGKIRIERHVTLDTSGNYVNHGVWRLHSPTETIVAEGQYDMGQRIGNWTRWLDRKDSPVFSQFPFNKFEPPFASQVNFTDGKMDGEWLIVDADNNKVMQVSLTEGERNGLVMSWLPNGKIYRQASYDQGVPVGDVLEADSKTGELKRIATYVDGRRIITKTAHYPRAKNRKGDEVKKSEEMFLAATTVEKTPDNFWIVQLAEYESQGKDLHHGPSKMWFESGKLQAEGFYQMDKRSGTFSYWYANGQVAATGEFVDDLPSDIWVWWHENGQKAAVGNYRTGSLIGDWRWWNEDGKLAQTKTFNGNEATASNPKDVLELGRAPSKKEAVARQTSAEQTR
jgi:antitoxin component YwqK of YwqJK toxin-antitoxin module